MRSSSKPIEAAAYGHSAAATGDGEGEMKKLKAELGREHEMLLRALADFDNYRGRVEREREKAAQSGKREVLAGLLDAVDGFERALQLTADVPGGIGEGFQAIHRSLLNLLKANDVTPFESVGQAFDPALHEAIGVLSDSNQETGEVAEEVQRGYRLGAELLRPARVRVAQ